MAANDNKVKLNVYDLSGGLARQFSPMFVGKVIEGIWHTGVVFNGKEYYFGGGIQCCAATSSPYGVPVHVYDLGSTEIDEALFIEFLDGLRGRYNVSTYDLFSNNCNNFSNEVALFLTGQLVPAHITGLPQEILATPFGAMIKPMLEQMQQRQMSTNNPLFTGEWHANNGNGGNYGSSGGVPVSTSSAVESLVATAMMAERNDTPYALFDSDESIDTLARRVVTNDDAVVARVVALAEVNDGDDDGGTVVELLAKCAQSNGDAAAALIGALLRLDSMSVLLTTPPADAQCIERAWTNASEASVPLLRALCNLFAHARSTAWIARPHRVERAVASIGDAFDSSSSSTDARMAAASLAGNLVRAVPPAQFPPDAMLQLIVCLQHVLSQQGTDNDSIDVAFANVLLSALAAAALQSPECADVLRCTELNVGRFLSNESTHVQAQRLADALK
jgi:PPPDE putative peptidase domain/PUL domain